MPNIDLDGLVQSLYRHQQISSQKAEQILAVSFRPLEETLRDEVVWYRHHRPELVGQDEIPRYDPPLPESCVLMSIFT